MKKRYLPIISMFGITAVANAQQVELPRSVVASGGSSATINNTIFQYTIGETLITAIENSPLLVTQGFQQPELNSSTPPIEAPLITGFIVYPNPASSQTKLEFDLINDDLVNIQLVNNAGQTVRNISLKMLAGKANYILPLSGYPSGLYYVVIKASRRTYSEKLVIQ
ncbi:T9SS type A sorting domain-containing protein [Pedobacter sp. B4-66]|uniref:T9SS type A sorting domain-containing protein n=1 Tax=Pedobacter sp. B4-66 TaxID=2817280 RepID=UPI001BDA1815|nr:T9SS type A sorting domain-containing protein [Pedobacter sp. B4-66]